MTSDVRNRLIVVACCILLSLACLLPTFVPALKQSWISRPISLGLDLSGGVHLVYEVQSKEAVTSRLQTQANGIRTVFRNEKIAAVKVAANAQQQIEIFLTSDRRVEDAKRIVETTYRDLLLSGQSPDGERVKLTYSITDETARRIEDQAILQAVETLRARVDQFGVAEPLIQRQGDKRILLQMPGVRDIEGVKRVVGKLAKLEFRLVPTSPGAAGSQQLKSREGGNQWVEEQVLMGGDSVESALSHFDPTHGQNEVQLTMTSEGSRTFRRITEENQGRLLAIVLDGVVYSSPRINERISGGVASITGRFSPEEAKELAFVLRAGALPAPLKSVEERTVGPTLGRESIQKGLLAIAVGVGAVFIFTMWYYRLSGVVAVGTLILNGLFLMALLSGLGATLTLPGLAAAALTIGMAVDSNVLIFERIRDELRNGASRDAAVAVGFNKALSAITDANVTTLLTGMILYFLGTGPIRGFAVMLSLGILTTLFCAIYVARLGFDLFSLHGKSGELSI